MNQYAQNALRDVREAAKLHYFDRRAAVQGIKVEDADYQPLRGRADFLALVADLETALKK
jgi:hypothetical protein